MINVGVIGCGYWGPNLIRNFYEISLSRMSICCDLERERLKYISSRYPIKTTNNYKEILSDPDIDAVVIATPISTHFKLAKEALLAGKDVLVEKPLATSSEEAEELIELSEFKNRVLMVGHTFEYSPPVLKVKELISKGEIGDVYYIASSRVNLGLYQPDNCVIWDLGPHDVSILLFWLNTEPVSVSARGSCCIKKDIEDVAFITIKFSNGVIAHLHLSWLSPCKLRKVTVVGSKKMIVYDDTESVEKVKVYNNGVVVKNPETFGEFQLTYRTGDVVSPKVESIEPLKSEVTHFLECIINGNTPRSDGRDGLRVVKVLEAAQRSLKNDGGKEEIYWDKYCIKGQSYIKR